MDLVKELQQTFDENIPLVGGLEAKVESYDGQTLEIALPLAANVNHKNTAFGGSLYCAAVLSAWGVLYLKLREAKEEGVIVIFDGRIHYHKPVTTGFVSISEQSDNAAWQRFLKIYRRMGKSRLKINSDIICGGEVCVSFMGEFVVQKSE
ncbi:thioesterase domain-containing protein [Alkalimarinus alittae]|uniref:Thioesterase domain-containing protein n=1 Tax=Alkalimarinus alittae TaxID=2961619 RepID=A0ABY6N6Q7_9ALTE|nr:thioesterase domain-containing protein [Alkalimarinus alittae]UZE97669.1 thioesterase domain-containing protein [Alkalimarinus alittae]